MKNTSKNGVSIIDPLEMSFTDLITKKNEYLIDKIIDENKNKSEEKENQLISFINDVDAKIDAINQSLPESYINPAYETVSLIIEKEDLHRKREIAVKLHQQLFPGSNIKFD